MFFISKSDHMNKKINLDVFSNMHLEGRVKLVKKNPNFLYIWKRKSRLWVLRYGVKQSKNG